MLEINEFLIMILFSALHVWKTYERDIPHTREPVVSSYKLV